MSDFSAGCVYTGRLASQFKKGTSYKDNQKLIEFNIYAHIRDVCLHPTRKCSLLYAIQCRLCNSSMQRLKKSNGPLAFSGYRARSLV